MKLTASLDERMGKCFPDRVALFCIVPVNDNSEANVTGFRLRLLRQALNLIEFNLSF